MIGICDDISFSVVRRIIRFLFTALEPVAQAGIQDKIDAYNAIQKEIKETLELTDGEFFKLAQIPSEFDTGDELIFISNGKKYKIVFDQYTFDIVLQEVFEPTSADQEKFPNARFITHTVIFALKGDYPCISWAEVSVRSGSSITNTIVKVSLEFDIGFDVDDEDNGDCVIQSNYSELIEHTADETLRSLKRHPEKFTENGLYTLNDIIAASERIENYNQLLKFE